MEWKSGARSFGAKTQSWFCPVVFQGGSGWGEIRIQRWGWTETARLMGRHGGSALVVGTLHGENAGTIAGTKSGGLVGYSTKCLKLHPLF